MSRPIRTSTYRPGTRENATSSAMTYLALVVHDPGELATSVSSGASATDADATNLVATFTVPASGKVRVHMSAWAKADTAAGFASWLLRTTGNVAVANSQMRVGSYIGSGSGTVTRLNYDNVLTGLTPGATLTWKWSHLAGGAGNSVVYRGQGYGPAILEIVGLPA